jgi:hypothetical protein
MSPEPSNLIGNDEITCGNVYSTLWHVRAFNDSSHPIAGDADTWGACKRLKRRSKTMLSWDAILHKLAAGSDGCIAFASDVSVESAFRTHGRRGRHLNTFHSHPRHIAAGKSE